VRPAASPALHCRQVGLAAAEPGDKGPADTQPSSLASRLLVASSQAWSSQLRCARKGVWRPCPMLRPSWRSSSCCGACAARARNGRTCNRSRSRICHGRRSSSACKLRSHALLSPGKGAELPSAASGHPRVAAETGVGCLHRQTRRPPRYRPPPPQPTCSQPWPWEHRA